MTVRRWNTCNTNYTCTVYPSDGIVNATGGCWVEKRLSGNPDVCIWKQRNSAVNFPAKCRCCCLRFHSNDDCWRHTQRKWLFSNLWGVYFVNVGTKDTASIVSDCVKHDRENKVGRWWIFERGVSTFRDTTSLSNITGLKPMNTLLRPWKTKEFVTPDLRRIFQGASTKLVSNLVGTRTQSYEGQSKTCVYTRCIQNDTHL